MVIYYYRCNTFYYNQMQFQLACSALLVLIECKCTFIILCIAIATFITAVFIFPSLFAIVKYLDDTCINNLYYKRSCNLHNCSHNKPIFTGNQEVFQDCFIKAGNCVSLCALLTPFSMLKYFQTQHFPRTLCPLP